MKNNKYFN